MCIANFVRRPVAIRKPLDKDGLEDCARQASLVWALASEMSMAVPVSPDKIQQCWFNVFQEGDMNIELTLQQAIAEKKDTFTWKDVTELRELSQSHLQQEREAETLQQARRWNYQRHVACRDAALAMMDPENPGCRFFLQVWNTRKGADHLGFIRSAEEVLSKGRYKTFMHLPWLNWVSTSMVPAKVMQAQAEMMGSLVNAPNNMSIGCCLLPILGVVHGGWGQLWRTQTKVHEKLFSCNVNADGLAILRFKGRTDRRSEFPLLLKAAICLPLPPPSCGKTDPTGVEKFSRAVRIMPH